MCQPMGNKYEPLSSFLKGADATVLRLSFADLDAFVGGLPQSARDHRTWWGNSPNHPHAAAWMTAGWIVDAVDLNQQQVVLRRGSPESRGPTGREQILDGTTALESLIQQASYASIEAAVAQHTIFLHPETVAQTNGQAVVPVVRDPVRRGQIGTSADGSRVMFCDNQSATNVFLWAADRTKGPDVQFNHVWNTAGDPQSFTALWNVCCTPAFLAKTTDSHPAITALLAHRSYDLYGHVPDGVAVPEAPPGYNGLTWHAMPEPAQSLESRLRGRMKAAPSSRAAIAGAVIGWLFSDGPDSRLSDAPAPAPRSRES